MPALSSHLRRQLWANPNPTTYIPKECRPVRLRSGGLLSIGNETVLTLAQDALFQPECKDYPDVNVTAASFNISVFDDQEPFYASTSPQIYAIAAATVVSYMLLIILFITPRTFFFGGAGGGSGFLGRRGMINGASGSTSVIGVGSRPWLQKVAALTVAVSLTIASVDTFKIAEKQYHSGFQDATALTDAVADGMEIRVVRIISDTCLWLAQAQTLIRLFPRHKEKVIIKWTAFAMISLDVIFSILNSFVYGNAKTRPRTFVDVVPAVNYLFALVLSILYMAWVLYYSISKRRFAFYHPKMRNICLMAVLSVTSIVIPVLFFVLDIAKPNVSGWGNYVRWVGAAAASVVVWEWVERIEALERDENKDGILGREIFDGDEMLETARTGPSRRQPRDDDDGSTTARASDHQGQHAGAGATSGSSGTTSITSSITSRLRQSRLPQYRPRILRHRNRGTPTIDESCPKARAVGPAPEIHSHDATPPPTTASPISRANTTSAASTIYRIHYHPMGVAESFTQAAVGDPDPAPDDVLQTSSSTVARPSRDENARTLPASGNLEPRTSVTVSTWQRIASHFKRQRTSPPAEVSQALSDENLPQNSSDVETYANPRRPKFLDKLRYKDKQEAEELPLPVTIIPWQPRGMAYLRTIDNRASSSEAIIERPDPSRQDGGQSQPIDHPPDAVANAVRSIRRSPSTNASEASSWHSLNPVLSDNGTTPDAQRQTPPRVPATDLATVAEVDDPYPAAAIPGQRALIEAGDSMTPVNNTM